MTSLSTTLTMALLAFAANLGQAQQAPQPAATAVADPSAPQQVKPAKATPQSEAGEPRADTSRPAAVPPRQSSASSQPAASGQRLPSGTGQKAPGAIDRLELGTATVTGDREQPKVMYIVPWKKSDIGNLAGKPMNSLVDEILAPVDRDVFKREVVYYKAVQADASQNGAAGRP
ncbi:MAG: hypothetical protein M3O26_20460 [Pseudomonadota bacterium]|nr:hypothetical protein [Pseudomonadota bacterium]